jgi:hypothetical protein
MLLAAMKLHRDSLAGYYRAYLCLTPLARDLLDVEVPKEGGTDKFSHSILLNPSKTTILYFFIFFRFINIK